MCALDNIEAEAQPDPFDHRETIPRTGGPWTVVDTMASTEEDHDIHEGISVSGYEGNL